MIKSNITKYIFHPFFLSLIPLVGAVMLIPDIFAKFTAKHAGDEFMGQNIQLFFNDLDGDGTSERISFDLEDSLQTKIIFFKGLSVIDQYNIKYQPWHTKAILFDDFNGDGYSECYIFTTSSDSVFLNIIDPLKRAVLLVKDRFIDNFVKTTQSTDKPSVWITGLFDVNLSGKKDLCFYITAGFSLQPRNMYYFDITNNRVFKSPESGSTISGCSIADINGDSYPEFILNTSATGNIHVDFPYSDDFTWLMILNSNLQFIFPPVKICPYPARLKVLPIIYGERVYIAALSDYFGNKKAESSFFLFTNEGKILSRKPIGNYEIGFGEIMPNPDNHETFFFAGSRSGEISLLDSSFKMIRKIQIPPLSHFQPLCEVDADNDGRIERIFSGNDRRSVIILRDNFAGAVTWIHNGQSNESPAISTVISRNEKPLLYLQFTGHGSYINYGKNWLYYFKYPIYLAIYLISIMFFYILETIQKHRLQLKWETGKRIAGLQMRAVKNQADPHFTLNILNAIGSLYATETDRDKADYLFAKYARLIRQTVISSDKITVPLAEELDFIRNYLDLEKFRHDNSFVYSIEAETGVNENLMIPRMLIHTFVENAVKYGLRDNGGLIKIVIAAGDQCCEVIIEDNGKGLGAATNGNKGTGKGLVIVGELIDLYKKLEGVAISYSLDDIRGKEAEVLGVRARIIIPV